MELFDIKKLAIIAIATIIVATTVLAIVGCSYIPEGDVDVTYKIYPHTQHCDCGSCFK